ncbi:unnamed protein product [Toxocara canis]|uniref:Hemophilus-specific protein n=1 Tax=Toxocara canis TaxID=6265 RepID=A0A183U3X7_TOXCA|nr:unnamed protein product [Toxocara canis]
MESGGEYNLDTSVTCDWMQRADGLDEFRCFSLAEGDTRWFIYWIREAQIFGVTDGMTKVFETEMSRAERRKLLGNVADSRLEDDWRFALLVDRFRCSATNV